MAGAGICSRTAGCSALGYPAAGLHGQAGLPSMMSLGTYAQGTVLQESIFAGAASEPNKSSNRAAYASDGAPGAAGYGRRRVIWRQRFGYQESWARQFSPLEW